MKLLLHILLKPFFLRNRRRKRVTFSHTGLRSKLINPRFVGFLETSNFQKFHLDKHERKLRRKAVWGRMSLLIGFLIFGWLVIESAQALSLF